jgi:cyclase
MDRRTALKLLAGIAGGMTLLSATSRTRFIFGATEADEANLAKHAQAFIDAKVGIQHLTPSLTLVFGPGGNIAVLADDHQVVVIDCGVKQRSHDVLKTIDTISPAPRKTLINTHYHFDHTGGNAALATAGFTTVAQSNVRTRLMTDQHVAALDVTIPASPKIAWPGIVFADSTTLFAVDEELLVQHVAPAHTDGDSFIHFKNANVIHCGDIYFNGLYPVIDYSAGGNLDGMIDAAGEILKIADAKTQIIPGHGPLGDKQSLTTYQQMLTTVRDKIKPMVQAGKSSDEIVATKPTAEFDATWGKGIFTGDQFTALLVACYQAKMKS